MTSMELLWNYGTTWTYSITFGKRICKKRKKKKKRLKDSDCGQGPLLHVLPPVTITYNEE